MAHLSPTPPLCAEVQKPKPPPWPQERYRGEAPYREPLHLDTLARMELTGKATSMARDKLKNGLAAGEVGRGLGNPVSPRKGVCLDSRPLDFRSGPNGDS